MKRWAALTVALYSVFLSFLAYPLFLLLRERDNPAEIVAGYYIYIAPLLILVQAVLLLIPLAKAQQRPIKRRRIAVSAIIAGIPMGALTLAFVAFALLIFFKEDAVGLDEWTFLVILVALWLLWGFIFWKRYANRNSDDFLAAITQWLLKGSILELLVAVPSHIISRRRDECCAPPITLLGIAMGLSVAVLSFGPGVFFLFARRIEDKSRASKG
jgi:hypothetical protein